jgi:hypothetical protein
MTNESVVVKRIQRCQCEACSIANAQHTSWCAVHNAPALPIGACSCGIQKLQDLIAADVIKHHGWT